MKWIVRSGNGVTWHKTKKAAHLYAVIIADEHGWAEVLRVRSYSLPPELVESI